MMKKVLLTVIVVFILSACSQSDTIPESDEKSLLTPSPQAYQKTTAYLIPEQPSVSAEGCLPPLLTFAFPYGDTQLQPPEREPVLPPSEWKYISTLPQSDQIDFYELSLVRSMDTYHEIWVLAGNYQDLYRYRTDIQEWVINEDANISSASGIFLDDKNNVWSARLRIDYEKGFLRRFDEKSGVFKPVYEKNKTSLSNGFSTTSSVKVDKKGVFWIMANIGRNYELISYDPSTQVSKVHLEGSYGSSIEISPDNKIFLITQAVNQYTNQTTNFLVIFSPDTGETDKLEVPIQLKSLTLAGLYFDDHERLWVNADGWYDFSNFPYPQWFTIIKPPIFVNNSPGHGLWGWDIPFFATESEDGLLWYASSRGTGWLDTKDGKWCLFTSYRSNVLKDDDQNLWILVDDKLYARESDQ